jgi:hypothetical protein
MSVVGLEHVGLDNLEEIFDVAEDYVLDLGDRVVEKGKQTLSDCLQ